MISESLLSSKQLADRLGRSISYVDAMKFSGFRMLAGRTTLSSAIGWLAKNPKPMQRAKQLRKSKKQQNKAA